MPGPVTVLACTLSYPCGSEDANLLRMLSLRRLTDGPVGYSDHTFGVGAMIRAYELGAEMVEKHFTITPGEGGDHDFAVTPDQMQSYWLYKERPSAEVYDGVSQLGPVASELQAREGARRSLHAGRDLTQGNMLRSNDVMMLRPGTGLEPWQLDEYLGRPLKRDVPAGQVLTAEDF